MTSRRGFIKQAGIVGGMFLLNPEFAFSLNSENDQIAVVHTHGLFYHLGEKDLQHEFVKYQTLIDEIFAEHKFVILLNSGNMFQNMPNFNLFAGVPEINWMNKANFHATSLGHADFENGVEKLAEVIKHANFPIINCNYCFKGTALEGKILPYTTIKIAGKKIGITGVGQALHHSLPSKLYQGITFNHPLTQLQAVVQNLKHTENCDKVIVLSQLDHSVHQDCINDSELANKTSGIDLILGINGSDSSNTTGFPNHKLGEIESISSTGFAVQKILL